ncbi:hypothetical protein ACWDFL_32160 [Streptomyces bungoensis]
MTNPVHERVPTTGWESLDVALADPEDYAAYRWHDQADRDHVLRRSLESADTAVTRRVHPWPRRTVAPRSGAACSCGIQIGGAQEVGGLAGHVDGDGQLRCRDALMPDGLRALGGNETGYARLLVKGDWVLRPGL